MACRAPTPGRRVTAGAERTEFLGAGAVCGCVRGSGAGGTRGTEDGVRWGTTELRAESGLPAVRLVAHDDTVAGYDNA
jgi:hypothetical protein